MVRYKKVILNAKTKIRFPVSYRDQRKLSGFLLCVFHDKPGCFICAIILIISILLKLLTSRLSV